MATWEDVFSSPEFTGQDRAYLRTFVRLRNGLSPDTPGVVAVLKSRIQSDINPEQREATAADPINTISQLGTAGFIGLAAKDLLLGDVKALLALSQNVTFAEFIFEESIQAAAFPISQLIRDELYDLAIQQISYVEGLVAQLRQINSSLGFLAPITISAFSAFADAIGGQMELYRAQLRKKGIELSAPGQTPATSTGALVLESNPPRAQIYIDGRFTNKLTPEDFALPPDDYKIELKHSNFDSYVTTLRLDAGRKKILNVDLATHEVKLSEVPFLLTSPPRIDLPPAVVLPPADQGGETPGGETPPPPPPPPPPPVPTNVITRGPYSFTYANENERVLLSDFLGIDPPGLDLDAYLLNRTAPEQLDAWRDYWFSVWLDAGRQDIASFLSLKAAEYRERLFPEPGAQPSNSYGGFSVGDTISLRFYDSPPNDFVSGAKITMLETGGNYGDGSPALVGVTFEGRLKTFTWSQFQGRSPVIL